MDIGLRQRLVDAALICPQRTAALQEQGDAFEWKTMVRLRQIRSKLEIHGLFFSADVVHEVRAVKKC
jgi:hypothetical protein